jgi:hypothetical protein
MLEDKIVSGNDRASGAPSSICDAKICNSQRSLRPRI